MKNVTVYILAETLTNIVLHLVGSEAKGRISKRKQQESTANFP